MYVGVGENECRIEVCKVHGSARFVIRYFVQRGDQFLGDTDFLWADGHEGGCAPPSPGVHLRIPSPQDHDGFPNDASNHR